MDGLQITFICVMIIVVILLIISFVCHYFGPRAMAWCRSNREEKIGLSKSKIFHANGYMIHSGSDFLQLSSTGSFKRFDSIDRDYKQVGQSSINSPSWNIPPSDTNIPPQPLRPAPAPAAILARQNTIKTIHQPEQSINHITKLSHNEMIHSPIQQQLYNQQIIEKPIKQKSLEYFEAKNSSKSTSSPIINSTIIPRPVAKRQLSTPIENCFNSTFNINENEVGTLIGNGDIIGRINLSEVASKIQANNNNFNIKNNIDRKYSSSPPTPVHTSGGKIISPKIRRQRLLMEHQQQQLQKISNIRNVTNTNPFVNGVNMTFAEFDEKQMSLPSLSSGTKRYENSQNYMRDMQSSLHEKIGSKNQKNAENSIQFINQNKNPFTADPILQYHRKKQESISSTEDAFDLLPELKEPPKTDLDRFTIFNFEPDNINTILSKKQMSPKDLTDHFTVKSDFTHKVNNISISSPKQFSNNKTHNSLSSLGDSIYSPSPNTPPSESSLQSKYSNSQNIFSQLNQPNGIINTAFSSVIKTDNSNIQSYVTDTSNQLNQKYDSNNKINSIGNEPRNYLLNRFDSNIDKLINQNMVMNAAKLHNDNHSSSVPLLFDNQNKINEPDYSKDPTKSSFWNNISTLSNNRNENATSKLSSILKFQRRASSASQLFSFDKKVELDQQPEFRSPKSFQLYGNGNGVGNHSPYYSLQKTLFTNATSPQDKQSLPSSTSNGSIFDYSNGISPFSKYLGSSNQNVATVEKNENETEVASNQTIQYNKKQYNGPQINSINTSVKTQSTSNIQNSKYSPVTNPQQSIVESKENNYNLNQIISAPASPKPLNYQNDDNNFVNSTSVPLYNNTNSMAFYTPPSNLNTLTETDINIANINNNSIIKKYLDSPCSDVFDDIEQMIRKRYRNRSHSETEATENDTKVFNRNSTFRRSLNTNPFMEKGTQMLHKTFSENFLTKSFHAAQQQQQQNYQTWCFGRTFSRQESLSLNSGRRNSSQSSLNDSERGSSFDSLHHAISSESVSSISSVVLSDLESVVPVVTGKLCVGLKYEQSEEFDNGVELNVNVMEAKDLIGPANVKSFDTFVRMYLVPDETGARQTKLFKNSTSPCYNETFSFCLDNNKGQRSLWFHLYHSGNSHSLIGETELQITDVSTDRPFTTWLKLADTRNINPKYGELMFSLSYLPTAERLTVVVVKGRNFQFEQNANELETQNIFVKVYLLKDNKKISKKKTTLKRKDRCPIFNESMIFSIPSYVLNSIQVRLTVLSISSDQQISIQQQQQQQQQQYQTLISNQQQQQNYETHGHIFIGNSTTGKGIKHWNQMLSSLRKPVAMWHPLRKAKPKSITKISNNIT